MARPNLWGTNGGVYFGFPTENLATVPRLKDQLRYAGDRHLVTIGANGSGKSRRLLLIALAELLGWSILVVDPKAELCLMTMEHRKRAGNAILSLNPFNSFDLGSHGYNPLSALDPESDDFPDDAMGQVEAIIKVEGSDPHWPQGAQDLVTAVSMFVRIEIPNGTYGDVRALLSLDADDLRHMILNETFEYKGATYRGVIRAAEEDGWDEIINKIARFGDISPDNKEMHGVISEALVQTRWLDSRPIKRDLGGPAFDFTQMKRTPTTIYLSLPARRLGTHSSWLRLMIATVVQALMKDTARAEVPVLLMLDEYFAIAGGDTGRATFPMIDRNMAMLRGYGIKLWTVWQDLSQAQRAYGRDGFETFLANAGVLQTFATQDLTTSDYISKRTGQTTRRVRSQGISQSMQPGQAPGSSINESANVSLVPMPLLLPQDIRNMDDGFALLFSHQFKGPAFSYLPYPDQLPHMRPIMRLDPS